VRAHRRSRTVRSVSTTQRERQRPVELTTGLLLLAGLGLFAGFAGMFAMGESPLSAVATIAGVLVAVLAVGALIGSPAARTTLLLLLAPLLVLVVLRRIDWLAVALVVAALPVAGSPRARAWYR
jgi:hypothetical protein